MKFIKLIGFKNPNWEESISYTNVDDILIFEEADNGGHTYTILFFKSKDIFEQRVKESPAEILKLIQEAKEV